MGQNSDELWKEVDVSKLEPRMARLIQDFDRARASTAANQARRRLNTRVLGIVTTATVFGIYFYSMYAVRQEKFLDDLDQKVIAERRKQD